MNRPPDHHAAPPGATHRGGAAVEPAGPVGAEAGIAGLPAGLLADAAPLPALAGELGRSLWRAVVPASGDAVVVAPLEQESTDTRRRVLERASSLEVEHYGVPARWRPEGHGDLLAWEIGSGRTLRADLDGGRGPSGRKVLELGRAVADVLAELHGVGFAVDGLCPACIWLGPAGLVQLVGLGTAPRRALGSGEGLRYRAPEQLRAEPSSMAERLLAGPLAARADIWSLGMILLELLDGRPRLLCRDPGELVTEIRETTLSPRPGTDPALAAVIEGMLEVDVESRLLSAREIADRLDEALATGARAVPRGRTATPEPPLPLPPPAPRPRTPDWRSAARSLAEHRRRFDREGGPGSPLVWILPALALLLILLLVFLLAPAP